MGIAAALHEHRPVGESLFRCSYVSSPPMQLCLV